MESPRVGFTLLELLICLTMLALATTWGIPRLSSAGGHTEAIQFTNILTRALMTARSTAVASGNSVTLCASTNRHSCLKNWLGEVSILVFTDRDRNYHLGSEDTLHLEQRLSLHHGTVYWRGSLGRPYLRYRVNGSAMEYGRYSYCPQIDSARNFRQVVVNRVGRVYLHHDDAGDSAICQ
jgi:type IV fimbrial biogenesis protein FimT